MKPADFVNRRLAVLTAVVSVLWITAGSAHADYLQVRSDATLKDRPVRDAVILERPRIGSYLELLENGRQTNGYYRAVGPTTHEAGWIYRTLVRRFPGTIPYDSGNAGLGPRTDGPGRLFGDIMRVHFIDVGQGDAALVEFSCGAMLIDAGGQNKHTTDALIQYLSDFFDRRPDLKQTIDTIIITHTHIDHNRALRRVVETFSVSNYVHNGVLEGSGRHIARWMADHANDNGRRVAARTVSHADIAPLPRTAALTSPEIDPLACAGTDPAIRVLAAPYRENPGWPHGAFDDGNNKSLVIRIDFGEASFLFTGDLEEHAIGTLVDYYRGTDTLDVDVYKVGHHGSDNGTTARLMQVMTPEIAVISMGRAGDRGMWTAWAYGHPRREIVELLDRWIDRPGPSTKWVSVAWGVRDFFQYRLRDAIYATGWDGTVIVSANRDGQFAVQTVGID